MAVKEMLTRFERARLISARALQLSLGAPMLATDPKGLSMNEIAKLELEKKVIPLTVLRKYPDGETRLVEVF